MQQVLERAVLRRPAHPSMVQQRVLVGADESGAGRAALRWAAGEAFRQGALLTVVRAISVPPHAGADRLRWETERRLHQAVSAVAGPQPAETLVVDGDPATALVALSEETELLVLGKSSRAKHRRVVGSITRQCLLRAHCPVVLVPEEAAPEFNGPPAVEPQDRHVGIPRSPLAELVGTR